MPNKITLSVEFHFKGKQFTPKIELDLDEHMHGGGGLLDFYPLLARADNIGAYSYEYEMLQAETIQYSNASGIALDHLSDGVFDIVAFKIAWAESEALKKIKKLAKDIMGIDDLSKHQSLQKSLLEAYQLGKLEKKVEKIILDENW